MKKTKRSTSVQNRSDRKKRVEIARGKMEYLINGLVNHSNENGKWRFKVRWYRLISADDTWERIKRFLAVESYDIRKKAYG